MKITENFFESSRHKTFYLAAGPESGVPLFFIHGWPDLSIGWTKQIKFFASQGYRVIVPDMRGYGASTIHETRRWKNHK